MATSAGSELIEKWLRVIVVPGSVVELRCTRSTRSGRFTDLTKLAENAHERSEAGDAVYFTINPCQEDNLGRNVNRINSGKATSDRDILRRARLLLDFDPVRPADTSATDEEKDAAWTLVCDVIAALEQDDWPTPAIVDSGNGYHAYYAVDLPADDGGLVAGFLKGLSKRFSTPEVEIDTKVGNASRISKVPGTISSKGADTEERPHRTSYLISAPDELQVVPREKLEAWRPAPPPTPTKGNLEKHGLNFDSPTQGREAILRRAVDYMASVPVAISGEGGSTVTLTAAAKIRKGFNLSDHETFTCMQDWNSRCLPAWSDKDLMRKVTESHKLGAADGSLLNSHRGDGGSPALTGEEWAEPETPQSKIRRKIMPELTEAKPNEAPVVLGGLLRQGELLMLVSGPKVGKSWLCMSLALSMLHGQPWLGRFSTSGGRVLMVDTELQEATLANRWKMVCKAHNVEVAETRGVEVVPLREDPMNMDQLCRALLHDIKPLEFGLIIIDSFYKLFGENQDENKNSCVTRMLTDLQKVATALQTAVVLVHHTSKGNQGGKTALDTGAGAGAMQRCVDSHMVIRQHEDDGVFVVEASVRSFTKQEPFCIRQSFPLWLLAEDSSPEGLRQEKPRARPAKIAELTWTPQKIVEACSSRPTAWGAVEARLEAEGLKGYRARQLRKQATDMEILFEGPPGSFSTERYTQSEFEKNVSKSKGIPEEIKTDKQAQVKASLEKHPERTGKQHAESCGVSVGYLSKIKKIHTENT